MAEIVTLTAYVTCLVLLLLFSMGQLDLVRLGRRNSTSQVAAAANAPWPTVTVQLPIYIEQYVVDRLLTAVANIDYPRDRLSVQVLDDSTDETGRLIEARISELRAAGLDIVRLHRSVRIGYKAGALAAGMERGTGELIGIFDADFVPAPDVLTRLVPYFADADVGAVQARWGHLNQAESTLTRVEAFLLDLHFRLEQPARAAAGLFLNFNGTVGIWRRTAIEDAGGWSAQTVTEDIDLSYRAQMRGWRLVYCEDYVCDGELPADMSGLRNQQHRWIKGGSQNARLHLRNLRRRRDLSRRVRRHARHHLIAGTTYVVILAMMILSVPLAALKGTGIPFDYKDFGIPFCVATVALVATFYSAQHPEGFRGHARFAGAMVAFMVFTLGLAVHNGRASLAGWTGRTSGEFVRTPKAGNRHWSETAYSSRRIDRRVIPDIVVLLLMLGGIAIGVARGEYAFVPLQVLAASGLTWVIGLTFWHPWLSRRQNGTCVDADNAMPSPTDPAGARAAANNSTWAQPSAEPQPAQEVR